MKRRKFLLQIRLKLTTPTNNKLVLWIKPKTEICHINIMCIFTFYPQPPHSSVKRANNFCFRLNPFPLYILLLIITSQILVRILVSVWVSYRSRREFGTEKSLGTGLEENLVPKKSRNRSRREFGTEKVPEPSRRKFVTEKKSRNRSRSDFWSRHTLLDIHWIDNINYFVNNLKIQVFDIEIYR